MKQQVNLPQTKRACGERRNEIIAVSRNIINQVAYLVDPYWYV